MLKLELERRLIEMKHPNRVVTDLARDEDIDEILALNILEYGPGDIIATPLDVAWRRDQNPGGRAIIPVIRDSHGQVVGFIWVVPLSLRVKGQNYLAATGTNLVIHPDYRNSFNYTKLIRKFEQVFKDGNIPLHFSFISERVYQAQRKRVPQTVLTVPLLVKLLDVKALAQTYPIQTWQRLAADRLGPLVSPFFYDQRLPVIDKSITVHLVDQFDETFDEFWNQVQDKYPVMLVRDQAFLAWRFALISQRRYHILVARRGNEILGYAVLRCATIHGIKTGLMMDLLVTQAAVGETVGAYLMAEAETYFRAQGMAVAIGLTTSLATEYRILRQAGYIYLPSALAPRVFRFAFYLHGQPESRLTSLSTRDWFVTMADYESF